MPWVLSATTSYTAFSGKKRGENYFIGAMGGVAFVTIGEALLRVPGVFAAEMEF